MGSSDLITNWALRSAINTTPLNLTSSTANPLEAKAAADAATSAIAAAAKSQAGPRVMANSDTSSVSSQMTLQAGLITGAVAVLGLACFAVIMQTKLLKDKRLIFEKELEAGIGTFMERLDKEDRYLTGEEHAIKNFLKLLKQFPSFTRYSGITDSILSTDKTIEFYSVLPLYQMGADLDQSVSGGTPLDHQRRAIHLFFSAAFPEMLSDLNVSFEDSNAVIDWVKSAFEGSNYLNYLRVPRFIMMALCNMLWNLTHAVDLETGFPLSLRDCIKLCAQAESFVNQLLDPNGEYYALHIKMHDELLAFLHHIEVHIKRLKSAYIEKRLNEINFDEITNRAHSALRIMDISVFKLMYTRTVRYRGQKKQIPDSKAADFLAYKVIFLNLLLMGNSDFMRYFDPFVAQIPMGAGINRPPVTIIDALIILCHLSESDRSSLLKSIRKKKSSSAVMFADELQQFCTKFIDPIRRVIKKKMDVASLLSAMRDVGLATASLLMPLITLVMEDYRIIELDTPETYQSVQQSSSGSVRSGQEQVHYINEMAFAGNGYYQWKLPPFDEDGSALDALPKYQYRMTQMTKLMDNVRELVKNYRGFLQYKSFQSFLLKCLNKIKSEYALLEQHLNKMERMVFNDETKNRSLVDILGTMMQHVNADLETFSSAMDDFKSAVSAPNFTDQQRRLLSGKIQVILDQWNKLSPDDDSGIADLVVTTPITEPTDTANSVSVAVPERDTHSSKEALIALVRLCHQGLSLQSKMGPKGRGLKELLATIDNKPILTEQHIERVLLLLMRITASYRETMFFQASYGETRSAKVLINAMRNPNFNRLLPFKKIFFDDPNLDLSAISTVQIQQRFKTLCETKGFQKSFQSMEVIWLEGVNSPTYAN